MKHFSTFGTVTKVLPRPAKNEVEVQFSDHESAKRAKQDGKIISQNIEPIGSIFFKKPSSKSHKTKSDEVPIPKKKEAVDTSKLLSLTRKQVFSDADR